MAGGCWMKRQTRGSNIRAVVDSLRTFSGGQSTVTLYIKITVLVLL